MAKIYHHDVLNNIYFTVIIKSDIDNKILGIQNTSWSSNGNTMASNT